jgi:ubiquinone/menaquinone biosynthesis C-methylase UbiE
MWYFKLGADLILDVGCDWNPFFVEGCEVVHVDVGRGDHLEVVCDAQHLPFRDKCFSMVYASHVIEHCKNPLLAAMEFKRVANTRVMVKVLNIKCDYFTDDHFYSWNRKTFESFLKLVFREVRVYPSVRVTHQKKPFLKLLSRAKMFFIIGLIGKPSELTAICKP